MARQRAELVDLDVVVRRETDDAWGIADPTTAGRIIWLPKSKCEILDGIKYPQKTATLKCPEWLALNEGLI